MTAAPSMAEVLENHAVAATGLGEWCCKCSPGEWRPLALRHRHVAQALAAAGFGHVASVERERDAYREAVEASTRELNDCAFAHGNGRPDILVRLEAAEAKVARVRELLEEWEAPFATWCDGREACLVGAQHLPGRLRGALDGEATP